MGKGKKRTPFFYGWIMVIVGAIGVFFSGPGQTYSVSIFIDSFIEEFNWSRSFVSGLYSGGTLAAGLLLFSVGNLIDRIGHRVMMPLIAGCLALACLWMSIVFHPLMLLLGFFMVRLFGQGSMTLVSTTLVPQWFERKRGRALSFTVLGGVASSALLPPVNSWLIHNFSWQAGWQFWALMLIAVMVPISALLVKNRPEDINLLPDGEPRTSKNLSEDENNREKSFSLPQVRRTPVFWLLIFCIFVPAMVNTGLTFHHVSLLGEQGIDALAAASILGMQAVVALPFNFLAGFLLDRWPSRFILGATFVGQVVSMVMLWAIFNVGTALIYGFLRGVVQGFERMSLNVIWPAYYGRKYLGGIRGFSMMFMVIGSAFGPLPFGFWYDTFGGYEGVIILMIIFSLLAALAAFFARPPQKEHRN